MSKELRDYVQKALEQGFSQEHIKRELKHAGYNPHEIGKAFSHPQIEKQVKHHRYFHKSVIGGMFLLIAAKLFILSALSDQSLFNIFIGFLPTIVSVTVAVVIAESFREHYSYVWVVPLIFLTVFYFLTLNSSLALELDIPQILVLNLVISYVFVLIITFVMPPQMQRIVYVQKPVIKQITAMAKKGEENQESKDAQEKQTQTLPQQASDSQKPTREIVQVLEDKCKVINQAIGRVYKKKNGGSEEMRVKIRIPAEWYNAFTDLKDNEEDVKPIIKQIVKRLHLLASTERDVFGKEVKYIRNLKRNIIGTSKIIDVLRDNDKDPINDYVSAAINVCEEVLEKR